jgi:UTP-glucose-1-phosphate uridylyltransferase
MELTLVVLAAGLSTRYGGPKQLEPVGPSGETLLDYGIYDALRAGFSRVVVVTRRELEPALREHVENVFGHAIDVVYARQELGALPEGFSVPPGRRKPWGTGHAVLTAEPDIAGPFVVMNADDFYGAAAYAKLAEHLRRAAGSADPDFAAAGYTLRDTLSRFGGVSRAVCELDDAGRLRRVIEVKDIVEREGSLSGFTLAGERMELTGGETISMNLWAATPVAFPLLRERFVEFLARHGRDPDAEFLLSTAVNELIEAGRVRVTVIPTPGPWLGVTYREDRDRVRVAIGRLIARGAYPGRLAAAVPDGGC